MSEDTPALLLVGNFLSHRPGRVVAVCERLAARLLDAGYSVTTVSRRESRIARLWQMVRTARHATYDVALIEVYSGHSFLWAEATARAAARRERRVVLALHGGMLPEWAASARRRRRAGRLLELADDVVSPSSLLVEWAEGLGVRATRLANGFDLSAFSWAPSWRPEPRLRWLRAMHPVYDPMTALEAVALLRARGLDATLELAGPDRGEAERLRARARELGVAAAVDLPGWVAPREVPGWLARGGVFLNTTTAESFGQSVVEAAAAGLPVVTTAVGELPRIWRDGAEVLFVEPRRPAAIAAAVTRLLEEPGLAEAIRRAARRRAEEFDWAAVLPEWRESFRRAAARVREPRPPR